MYKSIQSNEQCTECPENSDSSVTEATSCTCVKGYYRASSDGVNYPCTGKVNISIVKVYMISSSKYTSRSSQYFNICY